MKERIKRGTWERKDDGKSVYHASSLQAENIDWGSGQFYSVGILLQPYPWLDVYVQASSSSFEDVAAFALGECWVLRVSYGNPIVSSLL